jgi:hypothetical protein
MVVVSLTIVVVLVLYFSCSMSLPLAMHDYYLADLVLFGSDLYWHYPSLLLFIADPLLVPTVMLRVQIRVAPPVSTSDDCFATLV